MSNKLKTLNDLEPVDEATEPTGVYKEDLRNAAREWIKQIENGDSPLPKGLFVLPRNSV